MSCKVLELYLMDACLRKFKPINSGETLLLNIIRIKRLVAIE